MKRLITTASVFAICASVGANLVPSDVLAQAQPSVQNSTTDPAAGNNAEEVVLVTARRRDEALQDVPVAVSLFSADKLAAQQIETLTDLPGSVPNLNVSYITASSTAIIYLRGAGQDDTNPPSEQPITVYLDGVPYLKAPGAVFDLINLRSLEVLRGPQGTLYGRNSTGGAIKLTSRRPDFDQAVGLARATIGSFKKADFAGSFSTPLSDTFAVGLDFVSRSDEGMIRDAFSVGDGRRPNRYNATDRQTLRALAHWKPSAEFSVFAAIDYTDENPGPFTSTPALTSAAAANFVNGGFVDTPDLFGSPYLAAPTLFGQTAFTGSGISVVANYDMERISFEAIAGYRTFEQTNAFDTDGGPRTGTFNGVAFNRPGNAFDFVRDWEHDAYTLELKASSTTDGPLTWVAGLFFLKEDNVATSVLGRYTDPTSVAAPSATAQDQDQTTRSVAVFGEITYRPIEKLELTAGLRHTSDTKELRVRQYGAFGFPTFGGAAFPPYGPLNAEVEFDNLAPRVIVKYDFTDKVSAYASYSQGFQAGAFQGFQLTAANAVVPINETVVKSYELGLRSQWFDDRLTLNLTAFEANYDDLPTTQFTSSSGFLEARTFDAWIRGLEVDLTFRPIPQLVFTAAFGLTDNWVPNDIPATIGPPLVPGKLRNDLKYVSPFSGRLNAQYEADLPGDSGFLNFSGNVTVQGEFFTSTVNNPFAYEDGYTLVGLQIEYVTQDDKWSIAGGVKNLTDEIYELRSSADGGGSRNYGPPQSWYLSLQHRF